MLWKHNVNTTKAAAKRMEIAIRRADAARLRRSEWKLEDIAQKYGVEVCTIKKDIQWCKEELARTRTADSEANRLNEDAKLNDCAKEVWDLLYRQPGQKKVKKSKIMPDGSIQKVEVIVEVHPLKDTVRLQAIDRLLAISAQRRKLWGWDLQPPDVTTNNTMQVVNIIPPEAVERLSESELKALLEIVRRLEIGGRT